MAHPEFHMEETPLALFAAEADFVSAHSIDDADVQDAHLVPRKRRARRRREGAKRNRNRRAEMLGHRTLREIDAEEREASGESLPLNCPKARAKMERRKRLQHGGSRREELALHNQEAAEEAAEQESWDDWDYGDEGSHYDDDDEPYPEGETLGDILANSIDSPEVHTTGLRTA